MKTYSIVGINHTKKEEFVAALQAGKPVLLVREPNNKYDRNAVAVWIDGQRVGYVPRNQNTILAGFIDDVGKPWDQPVMAQDGVNAAPPVTWPKTLPAKFVRSPNSGFPLVEL